MLQPLRAWLETLDLAPVVAERIALVIGAAGVALVAWLANLIAKKIILRVVSRIIRKSRTDWDDLLQSRQVFTLFSHLAPALVIWGSAALVFDGHPSLVSLARTGAEIYMILVGLLVLNGLLNAVNDIYNKFEVSRRVPLRGYIQVLKILLAIAGGIFVLSVTLDRSPWIFLSGLGAMTAVILLIFKDAILGLVAGVQLNMNDMVRPGDWISMPKYGADGNVVEVALTTVKVRNWDKTITTVPTYALISDSFKNWRGMEESGGRRIKRAVLIDVNSIRFCDEDLLRRLSRIDLVRDYLQDKTEELAEHNRKHGIDDSVPVNGRRLTNIGTFRAYLAAYLQRLPTLHGPDSMTFLVRQLDPTEKGLPIEIYVFSKDQRWANYEAIQSDIFDHVFASLPQFDLRPFQNATGHDVRQGLDALRMDDGTEPVA